MARPDATLSGGQDTDEPPLSLSLAGTRLVVCEAKMPSAGAAEDGGARHGRCTHTSLWDASAGWRNQAGLVAPFTLSLRVGSVSRPGPSGTGGMKGKGVSRSLVTIACRLSSIEVCGLALRPVCLAALHVAA
jgi:hypothetical protein